MPIIAILLYSGEALSQCSLCVGVITTLVTPEHESALLKMAEDLKIKLDKADEPAVEPLTASDAAAADSHEDVERTKQGLEDIFNLY